MANFTYHPPTRTHCAVCEELIKTKVPPLIESLNGKASSSSSFPFHNWYYFVLGYTPQFPNFILDRENVSPEQFVVDPFMGAGTTLLACKQRGIKSCGIDANDYFFDVVKTKTTWKINISEAKKYSKKIIKKVSDTFLDFKNETNDNQSNLFLNGIQSWQEYAEKHRPEMLNIKYISDIPFAKLHLLKTTVDETIKSGTIKKLFDLAISSIIVPVSNVRYGPGFGIGKPKTDIDVLGIFEKKINRMIEDLETANESQIRTSSEIKHGDSRQIASYFPANSIDLMITSPPYPGDHEYTKHTRLELIFMGYALDKEQFRTIKKRMIRGSTTNIYKEDKETEHVMHFESIEKITALIKERLTSDGATSGFEKLYTRLVWEYFGGMYRMLTETHTVLKSGGKISLLVSDSHAFKMVHIRTADILAEIGLDIGYSRTDIELWQDKISTSHSYHLRENIITLTK